MLATNSTWTFNAALGGPLGGGPGSATGSTASGGGVFVTGGTAVLVNVTIAGNRAEGGNSWPTNNPPGPSLGGNLSCTYSCFLTMLNSIVANSVNGGDVYGIFWDGGYNLCSDATAHFSAAGSLNNTDPMLATLANNGGPTPTMALLIGSPARDAIPSGFPSVDQRGVARPQGPAADMGAFEADYIAGPPVIANQPHGGTVRAGTNVTFTVVAVATGSISYQWSKGGSPIAGATTSILTLANVQAANAGTYSVVVSNSFGATPSQGAVLVVDSTPRILTSPVSVVVTPAASTAFGVTADGPQLTYQWWHNDIAIPGASASTLPIASALAGAQGNYWVVVTNFAGSVTSVVVTLTFDASALSILAQPTDQIVESGYPASFTVIASGVPPFAYQWQHNGAPVSGATDSSLVLLSAHESDAGSYQVVVSNGYRVVTSSSAQLTITPGAVPPVIVVGRVDSVLTLTFTAEAGRTYRLLNSSNFIDWSPVATNSPLTPGVVQFATRISSVPSSFFRVVAP